ncbi:uncharacterized protein BYT42DRAFT_477020, partial [Radiomyces spectabilis]|uniref:uncharacterized protein n=1 Tax=Radiomyces spectabilis TaxID=64574 RepID=UPI0022208FDA
ELPISVPENMPHLGTAKVWLHISQVITTFMTICMVAPIISTESRFYGGSQPGPNYTLFVAIISIAIPIILIYFPWMYDRKNKFKKLGKFCLKPRTNMIFTSFYSVLWGTAGIAITVHANNPDHCNFDGEMQENYGNDYTSAWTTQCNLAKAAAGFTWITCLLWVATLICTLIIFWNEKQLIQKNLRTHEMNKQAALGMANDVENGQYQTAHPGYYEEDDAHVNVRPQSLDQARPLNNVSPPPMHEASPFESPYDPPVQPAYYQ